MTAPESEGERALGAVVKGIEPAPEWGVSDLVPGRRLDLGWRLALFGLEYDGIGSLEAWQSDGSSSTCLLHRQFGQWWR